MNDARAMRVVAAASMIVTALVAAALALHRPPASQAFAVPIYRHLILYQDFYLAAPFVAVLLAALVPRLRAVGERAAMACGRHIGAVALLSAFLLAIGTHAVFQAHPLAMDEYVVIFQSKLFLEGKLTARFPPWLLDWLIPPFLEGRFFRVSRATGTVTTVYWPAFSLLLAPFTAAGVPWLLNPLIGAATLLTVHRIALRLTASVRAAGLAALLTLASPAITINALTYYAMPAHLLANALYTLLLIRPTPLRAAIAGLVGSVALTLHNPVPHLLYSLPWIFWLASTRARWRMLAALAAGYLPLCLLLGWGWAALVQEVADETIGARLAGILGWTSSTGFATHGLDLVKLWLWAVPGMLVAAVWAARDLWRDEQRAWRILSASALATYFGYFLVAFDQGHGWGFRYFHGAWLALPLLAAGACRDDSRKTLAAYLAACALLSLFLLTPVRALQVRHFTDNHLDQAPAAPAGDARVIFINPRFGYYSWDLAQNDPGLRAAPLRLVSRGADADKTLMRERFPQYELLGADRRGSVWGIARAPAQR